MLSRNVYQLYTMKGRPETVMISRMNADSQKGFCHSNAQCSLDTVIHHNYATVRCFGIEILSQQSNKKGIDFQQQISSRRVLAFACPTAIFQSIKIVQQFIRIKSVLSSQNTRNCFGNMSRSHSFDSKGEIEK